MNDHVRPQVIKIRRAQDGTNVISFNSTGDGGVIFKQMPVPQDLAKRRELFKSLQDELTLNGPNQISPSKKKS